MPPPKSESLSYLQNADHCTHCGYCLPVCPTYRVENHENQSPRGRVSAILAFRQGRLSQEALADCLAPCLQCHGCHRACPAGVKPARMALSFKTRHPTPPPWLARALHRVTDSHLLTRLTSLALGVYHGLGLHALLRHGEGRWLPQGLAHWHSLLPKRRSVPRKWPLAKQEKPPRRVALLTGCMGRLFQPAIGRSAENLLRALGFEVVILTGFGCCGFPHREEGQRPAFVRQARLLLAAVERAGPVEAVICDSGSCAVTASVYGKALESHSDLAEKAAALSAKTRELTQFLLQEGLDQLPLADPAMGSIAFQGHCQSVNMLGILKQPEKLLKSMPVTVHELAGNELCCGAGGSYMLFHPAQSLAIRQLKVQSIVQARMDTLVGGNPGCLINLEAGLRLAKIPVETRHVAEILWQAFYNYRKKENE